MPVPISQFNARCCVWSIALCMVAPHTTSAQVVPLRARVGSVVDTIHGIPIADPFRELENVSDVKTADWVRSQDRYAREVIERAPLSAAVASEVRQIAGATVYSPSQFAGNWEFFSTYSASGPGAAIEVHARRTGQPGEAKPLVTLSETTTRFRASPLMFAPSPDGRLAVIGMAAAGSNRITMRIIETETGRWRSDVVPDVYRTAASISWHPNSAGFYYTRSDRSATSGPGAVFWHALGSASDSLLFSVSRDSQVVVTHSIAPEGRTLVVLVTSNNTRHTSVSVMNLSRAGTPLVPLPLPTGSYSLAGEYESELYFQTNASAPLGKVIAVRNSLPLVTRDVVPESDAPISTWGISGATVVGGHVLVAHIRASTHDVRIVSLNGQRTRHIVLPASGSIWSGFIGRPSARDVYYQMQGLADPGTIYRLNVESGRSDVYRTPALGYDPGALITERTMYRSFDGTLVPIHIVRRRDVALDGEAPLIMYGYGFGGWIAAPWFQPAMAAWVARGGIWAVAGVRGGGEHGQTWWDAGARRNKQVGINDYIAATQWLINTGYTAADRMIANSSSAGGPLVAAATLQRPELFRAAIHDYSIFDMLRYHTFGHGGTWQSEYGVASDPRDFAVLRSYSPYHAIASGSCPPSMLATPGELDKTAPPFHSYKFVAALRGAAARTCESSYLLRVSWGAGHAAGASPTLAADTWAAELGFLSYILGPVFPRVPRR